MNRQGSVCYSSGGGEGQLFWDRPKNPFPEADKTAAASGIRVCRYQCVTCFSSTSAAAGHFNLAENRYGYSYRWNEQPNGPLTFERQGGRRRGKTGRVYPPKPYASRSGGGRADTRRAPRTRRGVCRGRHWRRRRGGWACGTVSGALALPLVDARIIPSRLCVPSSYPNRSRQHG